MPMLRVMPSSFCARSQQRLDLVLALAAARPGSAPDLDRVGDGDVLARLVRDQLADAVAERVAHVQHAAHVADGGARGHGAEGGDLAHRVAAVLVLHVVDHAVAVALAEVDVEVGHRHPLRVQEALEQQVVLQRVEVGDLQRVRHQRAGARAPARAHRAAVVLGPVDEVAHDQEVAGEPHLQDGVDLELEPLHVARRSFSRCAASGYRCSSRSFRPSCEAMAEVLLDRHAVGRREVRQLRLAQHQRQVAALGDLQRVGDAPRHVGEQRLHLRGRLEVLLARELAHAPRVAQDLAFGDAHARLVRLVVVGRGELHRVRRHHRQVQARRQLHGGGHVRLVVGAAGALQLDVEAVREHRRPARSATSAGARLRRPAAAPGRPARPARRTAAIRPSPSSRSHSSLHTACARTTLCVQARASSSHRFR